MILYHAISVYQILCCTAHRLENHPREKSILVLPDFIRTKFPYYRELAEEGLFDEVFLFPYTQIRHDPASVYDSVERAYEKTIPYAIDEFEHVVNAGMHFYFSLYLIRHNKEFEAFEDSAGVLSRGNALGESIRCSNEAFYRIIESHGLYTAENELITKCYCNFKAQQESFVHEKAVDFDLAEKLRRTDKEIIHKLLKVFRAPEGIGVRNPEALILTQHFSNLNQMEFEEQVLLYQIITDYFLEGERLIIKPHPDDITYYGKLFPEARIIREKFPSELLPFIFTEMPDKLVSVSSTGSHLIKDLFRERLLFSFAYEKSFPFTHRYYVALQLMKFLGIREFRAAGADENLLANLIRSGAMEDLRMSTGAVEDLRMRSVGLDGLRMRTGKACIVGDPEEKDQEAPGADSEEVRIFLNTDGSCWFLEQSRAEEWEYFLPVVIRKERLREEDHYDDPQEETIYIYTKNKEIRAMAERFTESKRLEHVGSLLRAEALTDERRQIKVLEGILEATEKRMLYYKKRCRELEEK